jgi:hypothetical protein
MKNFIQTTAHALLITFSRFALLRYEPTIIGIGGVAGKAIAEQAITSVLIGVRRMRAVRRAQVSEDAFFSAILNLRISTKGMFYSVFAVSYALGGLLFGKKSRYPEALVLVYGRDTPGEAKALLQIARPHIAVVTSLKGAVLSDDDAKPDAVRLVESLTSSGYAILNMDDPEVALARDRTRANVLTFGFNSAADMRIMNYGERAEEDRSTGVFFKLHYGGSFVPIRLASVAGKEFAYAAAAAATVGVVLGMNLLQIAEALSKTDLRLGLRQG